MKTRSFTKIKSFSTRIYPCNIHIFKDCNREDVEQELINQYPEYKIFDISPEAFRHPGYTMVLENGAVLVFFQKDHIFDLGYIAHEAFHATEAVLAYVGVIHSEESSEAFAYLLQYIVNEITK